MSGAILVVDDDESMRRSLARLLRAHGYTAVEAAGGEAGLQLAVDMQPALVLMDLLMPAPNGAECTRRLKADVRTTSIPVIALTASDPSAQDARSFDRILIKPCAPEKLLSVVRAYVQPEQ